MRKGTQADVARELGVTRQSVSKLAKNRERTGMPSPADDGTYDLDDVRAWYLAFDPGRGPRRGIRAES